MDVDGFQVIDVPEEASIPEPPQYASISREFLFAGNAHFRVTNPAGEKLTYFLRSRMGQQGTQWNGQISYFLLAERTNGYAFVGVVVPDTGEVKIVGKSKFTPGDPVYNVAVWAIDVTINRLPIAPGYQITHVRRCGACGRTLVQPGDFVQGFHMDCIP